MVEEYLQNLLSPYLTERIDAVVLGCTHYVFLRDTIQRLVPGAVVLDGNEGTVRQLNRRLMEEGLCAPADQTGSVQLLTSGDVNTVIPLMERLLNLQYE